MKTITGEHFPNKYEIPDGLFKEEELYEVEDFLENPTVQPEAFFALARVVAESKKELFGTYHNLFYSQKEKSVTYIASLIADYEQALRSAGQVDQEKLNIKIKLGNAWIAFIEAHGENGLAIAQSAKAILQRSLVAKTGKGSRIRET